MAVSPVCARRRGFTLLEIALVLITLVALTAGAATVIGGSGSEATGRATREALVTVAARAGADALVDGGGVYDLTAVADAAAGLTVDGTPITVAAGAVTYGEQTRQTSTTAGAMVAHLDVTRTSITLVAKTTDGTRCAVVTATPDTIGDSYFTTPTGGTCTIP